MRIEKEKTRTKVHAEDTADFDDLKLALMQHCDRQQIREELVDKRDAETGKKIDKLMPLVDLIPTLETIAENQRAAVVVGRSVLRWIGYISAVLGLVWLILQFWKEVKR
jgi:hypothetical protein